MYRILEYIDILSTDYLQRERRKVWEPLSYTGYYITSR